MSYTKVRTLIAAVLSIVTACSGPSGLQPGAEKTGLPPVGYPAPATAVPTTQPEGYPAATQEAPSAPAPDPNSSPFRVTLADNGGTLTYTVTGRFGVFLDPDLYPESEFICTPSGIIGRVSNATGLYDESTGYSSIGFEAIEPGTCTLSNRDFQVTIQVIELNR